MKALSIQEPWITKIRDGEKTIELRKRPTNYRGKIVFVGSKAPEGKYSGKIAVMVDIVHCRPMTKEDEKAACHTYQERLYSWILKNKTKLIPINQKGRQGFFYVEDNLIVPIDQNK